MTARERSSIFETNLDIVTAKRGEDLKSLNKRTGNAWNVGNTAVMNGIFADHEFRGGELVKVVRRHHYRSSKPGDESKGENQSSVSVNPDKSRNKP